MNKVYIKDLIETLLEDHKKIAIKLEKIQTAIEEGTVSRVFLSNLAKSLTDVFFKEDTELYPILVRVQKIKEESTISLYETKRQVESREKGLSDLALHDDLGIQADLIAFAKSTLVIFKGLSECRTLLARGDKKALRNKWLEIQPVIEERLSYEETFLFPMVLDAVDQLGIK